MIDLEGGLDACIPTHSNHCLYVYFPFDDDDRFCRAYEAAGDRAAGRVAVATATACWPLRQGFNRSGLVAGLILTELGLTGPRRLARIRARRPGALFNDRFADYLA